MSGVPPLTVRAPLVWPEECRTGTGRCQTRGRRMWQTSDTRPAEAGRYSEESDGARVREQGRRVSTGRGRARPEQRPRADAGRARGAGQTADARARVDARAIRSGVGAF